jgi:phospholipid N-methyltransferase
MTEPKLQNRDTKRGNGVRQLGGSFLRFGRAFLTHPAMLGSVIPSSRFLVRRTLRPIDWSRADVVVEFGPGVGTITGEILERLSPESRLLVFETHPDFVDHLRENLADPRLEVIHGSAEDIEKVLDDRGLEGADYVLSGIPFSLMPSETRDSILKSTRRMLRPGGAMLVYQFSPSIGGPLREVFDVVDREFEPLNILPAVVYRCGVENGNGREQVV